MYAWIFRRLPGPLWFRIIQVLILLAIIVYALMTWVFPWANQFSPFTEPTIEIPEGQ